MTKKCTRDELKVISRLSPANWSMQLNDLDFSYEDLTMMNLYSMHFYNCDFTGAKLDHNQYKNCKFDNCSFRDVDLEFSSFDDVFFLDCNFDKAHLGGVSFNNCIHRGTSFMQTRLNGVSFNGGTLEISRGNILVLQAFDDVYSVVRVRVVGTRYHACVNGVSKCYDDWAESDVEEILKTISESGAYKKRVYRALAMTAKTLIGSCARHFGSSFADSLLDIPVPEPEVEHVECDKIKDALDAYEFCDYDKLLSVAVHMHTFREGHKNVMRGLNFVECKDCGKHAHVVPLRWDDEAYELLVHNDDYSVEKRINEYDF